MERRGGWSCADTLSIALPIGTLKKCLLWRDLVPEQMDEEETRAVVGRARGRAFKLLGPLLSATDHLSQVEALRLLLSTFADEESGPHHVLAVAAVPVFSAAIARRRKGQSPVAPDATLSLSADFLRMVNGATAPPEKVSALDTYLVTVADHGLNASTFTARIIVSTKAGLFSSVIGVLRAERPTARRRTRPRTRHA
jgi:citrate synthase